MTSKRSSNHSRRRHRLRLEFLEDRRLLAGVELEPNDSFAEANALVAEESTVVPALYRGVIEGTIELGDHDIFRFVALAGDQLSISVNAVNSLLDSRVILWDAAGSQLIIDHDGGPGQNSLLATYEVPSSGRYFIEVLGDSVATEGAYSLTLLSSRTTSLESDQHYRNGTISNSESLRFERNGNTFSSKAVGTIMAAEGALSIRTTSPWDV